MEYHIEIVTRDFQKQIIFQPNTETDTAHNVPTAFEDLCYAMSTVIEDKIKRHVDGHSIKARLLVPDMRYDDVLDIMCEDLSPDLIKMLSNSEANNIITTAPMQTSFA